MMMRFEFFIIFLSIVTLNVRALSDDVFGSLLSSLSEEDSFSFEAISMDPGTSSSFLDDNSYNNNDNDNDNDDDDLFTADSTIINSPPPTMMDYISSSDVTDESKFDPSFEFQAASSSPSSPCVSQNMLQQPATAAKVRLRARDGETCTSPQNTNNDNNPQPSIGGSGGFIDNPLGIFGDPSSSSNREEEEEEGKIQSAGSTKPTSATSCDPVFPVHLCCAGAGAKTNHRFSILSLRFVREIYATMEDCAPGMLLSLILFF